LRTTKCSTRNGAALHDPGVAAALQAMHAEPERPWTVATLAAAARMSRAAFARRFTGLVGQPPLRYLTWWRMTTAARLLRARDTPLDAVAASVGYTSTFAFSTTFKRRFGTTPARYRRTRPLA
jgi:AraC-like DNA-binding protein